MSPWFVGLLVFGSILIFVTVVLFVSSYITYRMAFYNNPKKNPSDPYRHIKDDCTDESALSRKLIDNIVPMPCEKIHTFSHDGLTLSARLYINKEDSGDAPFALQFHGYKSTPMLDFSGGGAFVMKMGFNVIMPDQRACGNSEGKTISFGYNESKDVLAWIEYVRKNYGENRKIILFGVSLGAGTVIISSGSGVPKNVVGVLADCPYSSAREIITRVIYSMKLPGKLLYPLVRLGAIIYGKFDPDKAEPKKSVLKTRIPILLIHGEDDDFVPCEMSRTIAKANSLVELHTFPKAKHGTSYIVDSSRYEKIASEFIEKCLSWNYNDIL